jgi:hypothetical protein
LAGRAGSLTTPDAATVVAGAAMPAGWAATALATDFAGLSCCFDQEM